MIVYKFVKFAYDASFLNSKNNKGIGATRLATTPEMSNFPKFVLSLPTIRPFSEEFKEHAISICNSSEAQSPTGLIQEESKGEVFPDNMGFYQAKTVEDFV